MCARKSCLHLALALLLGVASPTFARNGGIASPGCDGCHQGGQVPNVTLTMNPATVSPGGQTTITVTIPNVNGPNGGFYLKSSGPGSLSPGPGARAVNEDELVHSTPKAASGGNVTFTATFTAPSTPGGVDLEVWGLSGNGGGSGGDGSKYAFLSFVWGCAGNTYYRDFDGDGVGAVSSGTTKNCALPPGYSAQSNDCDDNDGQAKPGNTEICNKKDDNCNGQTDEGLAVTTFYPDNDKDGYGVPGTTTTAQGCTPPFGYAPNNTDCDDNNALRNPGKAEVCNGFDDDCDGKVDEGVKPTCGVGMCRREAPACRADLCTPAQPGTEVCNGLDDDCDGQIDEGGDLCGPGLECAVAECVESFEDPNDPGLPGIPGTPGTPLPDGGTSGGGGGGNGPPPSSTGCSQAAGSLGVLLALFALWMVRPRAVRLAATSRRRARGR